MKKKIVFSIILFSIPLFAQTEKENAGIKEGPLTFSNYFTPQTFLFESTFENQFGMMNFNSNFLNDSTSIMMGTRMQLTSFYNKPFEDSRNSLLNPMYQSYLDSQKNKFIKQVLGAVQLGAVGFLAYQHISKYGLFKKKD
jgi:hypothetical protein